MSTSVEQLCGEIQQLSGQQIFELSGSRDYEVHERFRELWCAHVRKSKIPLTTWQAAWMSFSPSWEIRRDRFYPSARMVMETMGVFSSFESRDHKIESTIKWMQVEALLGWARRMAKQFPGFDPIATLGETLQNSWGDNVSPQVFEYRVATFMANLHEACMHTIKLQEKESGSQGGHN